MRHAGKEGMVGIEGKEGDRFNLMNENKSQQAGKVSPPWQQASERQRKVFIYFVVVVVVVGVVVCVPPFWLSLL